jgi:hypothetical protein
MVLHHIVRCCFICICPSNTGGGGGGGESNEDRDAQLVARTTPQEIARLGADWILLYVSPFAAFI